MAWVAGLGELPGELRLPVLRQGVAPLDADALGGDSEAVVHPAAHVPVPSPVTHVMKAGKSRQKSYSYVRTFSQALLQ